MQTAAIQREDVHHFEASPLPMAAGLPPVFTSLAASDLILSL